MVEERADRGLGGEQSRRLHVPRIHRPRHVDHEDDGRPLLRHQRRRVRTCNGEAERGERREEERGRSDPSPGTATRDARERVEVREPDRVAHAPSFGKPQRTERGRNEEQREQEERMAEAHEPPAQTAPTWTIERTPRTALPVRVVIATRPRPTLRTASTLWTSAALGGLAVKNPTACQPCTRRSPAAQPRTACCVAFARKRSIRTRRIVGRPGGNAVGASAPDVRYGTGPLPPPEAGMQPICGRNVATRGEPPV